MGEMEKQYANSVNYYYLYNIYHGNFSYKTCKRQNLNINLSEQSENRTFYYQLLLEVYDVFSNEPDRFFFAMYNLVPLFP